MPDNLIRLKQLYQPEISGLVQNIISSNQYALTLSGGIGTVNLTGVTINLFDSFISGDSNTSGYFNNLFDSQNENQIVVTEPSGYLTGIGFSGNYDGGYFVKRQDLLRGVRSTIDEKIGDTFNEIKVATIINTSGNISRFKHVAINSNGKYITAVAGNSSTSFTGFIFTSNNYGKSWYQPNDGVSGDRWFAVAINNDGKYQSAVSFNGFIYTSDSYGINWTRRATSFGPRRWSSIAMNGDGKYQTALVYNDIDPATSRGVYLSENYGVDWSLIPTGGLNYSGLAWRGASINNDGDIQTIVSYDFVGYPGSIFVSNDYGKNWSEKNPNLSTTSRRYITTSISNLGKTQVAATQRNNSSDEKNNIFISNDYGNTWKGVGPTGINIDGACAINEDGSNIVACGYYGKGVDAGIVDALVDGSKIFVSNNYGETWTTKENNRNWTSIAISNNSKYVVATVYGDTGIYISKTPEFIDGDLYLEKIYSSGIYAPNIPDALPASIGIRRYVPDSTVTFTSSIPPTGVASYFPFILKKDAINPNICIEAVTLVQENNIRVGIYSGAGFEGAKLFFSGTITVPNLLTGIHKIKPNITIAKGAYTFATLYTGTSATTTTYRNASANGYMSFFGFPTGYSTFTAGALSTQSDLVAFESGLADLNSILGTGYWSRTSKSPIVCLEY